jgi:hypothetical protein
MRAPEFSVIKPRRALDKPSRRDPDTRVEKLVALLGQDDAPSRVDAERSPDTAVIAVIELRETRRKWFITGVEVCGDEHMLVGYEPRCRYGSAGDGWFVLGTDFFTDAALVSQDELDVHTMSSRVTLAELDIEDRF